MWAHYTSQTVRVACAEYDALSTYVWSDKTIEFCHCRNCGCLMYYTNVEKKSADTPIAVNARMMHPGDIANVRVRRFDGADTWELLA